MYHFFSNLPLNWVFWFFEECSYTCILNFNRLTVFFLKNLVVWSFASLICHIFTCIYTLMIIIYFDDNQIFDCIKKIFICLMTSCSLFGCVYTFNSWSLSLSCTSFWTRFLCRSEWGWARPISSLQFSIAISSSSVLLNPKCPYQKGTCNLPCIHVNIVQLYNKDKIVKNR